MSFLNLGLEALNPVLSSDKGNSDVSFDLLDATMRTEAASEDLSACIAKGDALVIALENLAIVKKTIKKFGMTPALESLLGVGFSLEAEEADAETSKEDEAAPKGDGWIKKAIKWFQELWASFTRWVKELFFRNEKWVRLCADARRDISTAKFKDEEYNVIYGPNGQDLETYVTPGGTYQGVYRIGRQIPEDVTPSKQKLDSDKVFKALNILTSQFSAIREMDKKVNEAFKTAIADLKANKSSSLADKKEEFKQALSVIKTLSGRLVEQASVYCKIAKQAKKAAGKAVEEE